MGEASRPLRSGDTIVGSASGANEEVLGFVVIHDVHAELVPDVDSSEDYVLSYPKGLGRRQRLYGEAVSGNWLPTGTDPLDGVTLHEVGPGWKERFDQALTCPVHPWASMALSLVEAANQSGWQVFPVGGLVRDVLLGADPTDPARVNDMDFAGTSPTVQFRRFLYEHLAAEAGNEPWRRNSFPLLRTSPTQVVHLRHVRQRGDSLVIDQEPTLQYAALKREWLTFEGTTSRLLSGSSFLIDSTWRDIRYNSLMYDPLNGVVVDPTGYGLGDLGLSPRDLLTDPTSAQRRRMAVAPLPVPEISSDSDAAMLWMNAVSRIVKQVADLGDAADYTACSQWFVEHSDRLNHYVHSDFQAAGVLRSKFTELRSALAVKSKLFPTPTLLRATLGDSFSRWLEQVAPEHRGTSVSIEQVQLTGYALAPTVGSTPPYSLGTIEAPEAATVRSATEYFADRLSGYRRTVVEVSFAGRTFAALALEDPHEFGPTFVEITNNAPIPAGENLA